MGSGSSPETVSRGAFAEPAVLPVFLPRFLRWDWEAAPAARCRFPLPWAGATSAHASRSVPAAAEEAAAFATESSLASTDAALPIPLNEVVLPFAPLPFARSAPCPFGLFFEFICLCPRLAHRLILECGSLLPL